MRLLASSSRQRKLTAWLGLVALWLTIAMPMVSQWRTQQAPRMHEEICSAHPAPQAPQSHPHAQHGKNLDACGYCSLLTQLPGIDADVAALPAIAPSTAMALPTTNAPAPPAERYARARPRDPPVGA